NRHRPGSRYCRRGSASSASNSSSQVPHKVFHQISRTFSHNRSRTRRSRIDVQVRATISSPNIEELDPLFLAHSRVSARSHSFPTAVLHLPIPFSHSLPHNSSGPLYPWPTLAISRTRSSSSPAEARLAKLRTLLLEGHERARAVSKECPRGPAGAQARGYLAGRAMTAETLRRLPTEFAPDSGLLLRDRLKGEFPEAARPER